MFFNYRGKINFWIKLLVIFLMVAIPSSVSAADGSGTNTVTPTSVIKNSSGNTLTFTFTAAELTDSGGIGITAPSGWSAPQGSAGIAGYTTASSTGIIADVRNNLDSAANWSSSNHMALSIDTSDKQEGTGSLSNAIGSTAAANEQWYFNYGSVSNWGDANATNPRVGMFLKSNISTASGDFSWRDDDSTNLASPLDTLDIPALTAGAWTYASVTIGAATRTSILSYGLRYTNDIGVVNLKTDSISIIFDAADSLTAWKSDGSITRSLLNTAGDHIEGTAAIRCAYAAGAGIGNAGQCYNNNGNFVIGPGSKVSFWIRSSVALNAGDFVWKDDDSADFASPLDTVSIPALAANTWTYVVLNAPNSSNITQKSYGLEREVNIGAVNIDIDAIGKQIDNCDAISNWVAPSADTLALSTSTATKHEGTGSLQNIISSSAVNGDHWSESLGSAANWSGYTTAGFWINSTVAAAADDIQFQYSPNADLSSPIASLNLDILPANTWTYQKLTLSGTRTSILSYGFKYNANVSARTIYVDDILLGPGNPTFAGQTINVRAFALTNPQTITVVYGSGGGASGSVATNTVGNSVFTTQSRISDGGTLTNIVSSPVVLVTDVASVFVLNSPGPIIAGNRAAYTVSRQDSFGNPVTVGTTVVNLSSNSTGVNKKFYDAASGGNIVTSVTIINGSSSANFWYYDELAGTFTITASQTGFTSGTNNQVVNPAATNQFTLNHPWSVPTGVRAAYTVTRRDVFGNPTTAGLQVVYLYSSSTSLTKAFYNSALGGMSIGFVNIEDGSPSADFWYLDDTPGTYTITASDNAVMPDGTTGIIDATDSLIVTAAAVKFVILDPGSGTAGVPLTVTVQAQDNFHNVDTAYNQDVTLNTTGSATGGGLVDIVSGAGTRNITDNVAETITLSLTDSQSTGLDVSSIQNVSFAAAATTQFILNNPGDITAGTRAAYTVTRKDQFGNLTASGNQAVYLYSTSVGVNKKFYDAASGGNIVTSVTIINGSSSANFWYYDELAGTFTITASDNASAPDNVTGIVDAADSLAVTPAADAALFLNHPGTVSANTRVAYVVTRKDAFGNPTTSGSIVVSLASNSTGVYNFYNAASGGSIITSVTITNTNSFADFWYSDDKPNTWTITASSGTLTSAMDSLTVTVSATKFVIINPGPGTAGVPLDVTVQAEDDYNNIDTNYSMGVTLAVTGSATGGGLVTIANGIGTKTITDNVSETVTLSLIDSQSTGLDVSSTQNVTFSPTTAAALFLNSPGPITAGTRASYTVTRKDAFGNLSTSGTTTVSLSSNSTGANKAFYNAPSGGSIITSVDITSGNSSANFWYYDDLIGTWIITATSAPLNQATDNLTVNPATAAALFLNHPGTIAAGARAAYAVTRKDSFGNLATSGITVVGLSSDSTGNKAFYDAASGGNIITSISIINTNSSANFWYFDDAPGTWNITASSAPLTPAVDSLTVTVSAAKFVIIQPADGTVDAPIVVTIQAQDSLNAIATTYSNSVTLNVSGSATGGGVVAITNGVGTKNISDTVAQTVNLSLTDSNATGLDVSSTKSVIFAPGATKKFLLNHPGTIVAGSRAAYTVTREDQFNNPAVSGSDNVYLYSTSGSVNKKFYDAATAGNIIASVSISDTSSLANFWYFDDMPGTHTITASDNAVAPDGATGVIDAADSLVVGVIPAAAVKFVILPPTDNTVGNPVVVTIQAKKADDSVDTTYTNTVTLNTSGSATGGGVVNIIDGVGTKTITDSVAETVNLSLADSSFTGLDVSSTQSVTFSEAGVSKFVLNNPGDMVQGTRLGYVVTREDVFNNPITTGTTTVYLYSSSASANSKFYDAATGTNVILSIDIINGASTANFWYYDDTPGTYVITVSDNAAAPDGSTGITDAAQSVIVSPEVVTPTKFIMTLSANTAQVNAPVTVTVKAVDNGNNVATTFNGTVTLLASGSATGGGIVTLASGVGIKTVSDAVVEIINISLQDTASTGLDISATEGISFMASPPAPPPIAPTVSTGYFKADIAFRGKAFPGAKVAIVYLDVVNNKVNTLTESAVTSSSGDFEIRFSNITERGFYSYALTVTDKDGHSVQTQSYRLDVAGAFFEKDIIMSPTISVLREAVSRGDFVAVQGYATPQSKIDFMVDRQSFNYDTTVDVSGSYKILFNTANLDFGPHSVQTRQRLTDSRLSEFSPQALFNVSQLFTVKTDLNNDGAVDVKDLSVFLSLWDSNDFVAKQKIDFNGDGVVDVKDFSIFVRTVQR